MKFLPYKWGENSRAQYIGGAVHPLPKRLFGATILGVSLRFSEIFGLSLTNRLSVTVAVRMKTKDVHEDYTNTGRCLWPGIHRIQYGTRYQMLVIDRLWSGVVGCWFGLEDFPLDGRFLYRLAGFSIGWQVSLSVGRFFFRLQVETIQFGLIKFRL